MVQSRRLAYFIVISIILAFSFLGVGGSENSDMGKEFYTGSSKQVGVDQADTTPPTLQVFSPLERNNISRSDFTLTLEVRDETSWFDLTVTFADQIIFSLINSGEEVDTPNLVQNQTYLFLEREVNLISFDQSLNRMFEIIVHDGNGNSDTFELQVLVDVFGPAITWLSPKDNDLVENNSITLVWEISDESAIKSQTLLLDGNDITPESGISGNSISLDILLPEKSEGTQTFNLTLIVIDIEDNVAVSTLSLFSSSGEVIELDTSDSDLRLLIVLSIAVFTFFLIGFFILQYFMGGGEDKERKKPWRGDLYSPPLLRMIEHLSKQDPSLLLQLSDVFQLIEDDWNTISEEILAKRKLNLGEIGDIIDLFVTNSMAKLLSEIDLNLQHYVGVESIFARWKDNIILKPKKWSGTLIDPPLNDIVEIIPFELVEDYPAFEQNIDLLIKEWQTLKAEIIELDRPSRSLVHKLLEDFASTWSIMLQKGASLEYRTVNELDDIFTSWLETILD